MMGSQTKVTVVTEHSEPFRPSPFSQSGVQLLTHVQRPSFPLPANMINDQKLYSTFLTTSADTSVGLKSLLPKGLLAFMRPETLMFQTKEASLVREGWWSNPTRTTHSLFLSFIPPLHTCLRSVVTTWKTIPFSSWYDRFFSTRHTEPLFLEPLYSFIPRLIFTHTSTLP